MKNSRIFKCAHKTKTQYLGNIKTNFVLPRNSFYMCIWYMCIYVFILGCVLAWICIGTHMCVHVCERPGIRTMFLPQLLSSVLTEAGSLADCGDHEIVTSPLTWQSCLCLLIAGITGRILNYKLSFPRGCCVSERQPSCSLAGAWCTRWHFFPSLNK